MVSDRFIRTVSALDRTALCRLSLQVLFLDPPLATVAMGPGSRLQHCEKVESFGSAGELSQLARPHEPETAWGGRQLAAGQVRWDA